mmetsp:Transcript_19123/g.21872  ORF Transcript_19123/g.21872 Transcript_19123/m.21872 type:complete len:450 (+) Transcript_19123:272-1621(+)|eukprot:CAMPEP_0194131024 /NCGR_PEP_ID=MMETSP0152-20130528/1872_1 /TAXON_ID=1049557 /ORGANISM="Thalassiothrix antarctica, Strain L6-D1" /LENGTH=449 /DNA_ID=CAMNT_0038825675 /DNA_START=246 /DNA_END=1595 /DNA_ORIENTATION=+
MSVIVPLPSGKLGLSFVGSGEVVVSSVKAAGAMSGRPIKTGYIVESVFLGSGAEEDVTSKKQLVAILNENSNDEGRKLKCKIAYKDEQEIELPVGDLGFRVTNRRDAPSITNIQPTCAIRSQLSANMVVNQVDINGYQLVGGSVDEITKLLDMSSNQEGRKLTLLRPGSELSEKTINFEGAKTLELPTGNLGIRLGASVPTIDEISPNSPIAGEIYPGMAIQAVRIPNGSQYDDLSGLVLHKVLVDTSNIEGRIINLISAEDNAAQLEPTLKFFPPSLGGSMAEIGFDTVVNDEGELVVSDIPDHSNLYGVLQPGLILSEYTWKEGSRMTSSTPTSRAELDELLLQSSGCDRFIIFHGVRNSFMPDQAVIDLQPGKLGITFKGNPARIAKIKDDSQVIGTPAMPGMVVSEAIIDGMTYTSPETPELTNALRDSSGSSSRQLTLVNPNKI